MVQLSQATLDYLKKRSSLDSLSKASDITETTHIPTGVFTLDVSLVGGIPENFITLIYGQPGSGKSTVSYKVAANAQKKYPDKAVVYIDLEGTTKPNYAWLAANGINIEELLIYEPTQGGEEAVDMAVKFLEDDAVSLVIFDSVPALVSEKRAENSVEDQVMSEFAKLVQPMLQKVNKLLLDARKQGKKKSFLMINQWRTKAGFVMGDPRILPGGQSQHFFSFAKIEMFNKEVQGKTSRGLDTIDYNEHSFKIAKYKGATAIRSGEFLISRNPDGELRPGTVDDFSTVARFAEKYDLIGGAGTSWRYTSPITGEVQQFKSKKEIVELLRNDVEEYETLKRTLVSMYRRDVGLKQDGWM